MQQGLELHAIKDLIPDADIVVLNGTNSKTTLFLKVYGRIKIDKSRNTSFTLVLFVVVP